MRPPSPWITRFAPLVRPGQTVLDVACGSGRQGRVFLDQGAQVTFVDQDVSALADLHNHSNAVLVQKDLEKDGDWPFDVACFDAVVVTNYLYRPTLKAMCDSIKEGGYLIYETFAVGNEKFGRPRNPDFLLKVDELLTLVSSDFQVVAFEQGIETDRVIQRMCACKGATDWSALV